MKKMFFSLALLTSTLANAAPPIDGWYSSVFGGYAFLPNNLNITRHGHYFSDAHFHPGYDAGASFGFKSTPMRYEGEFTYITAEPRHYNVDGIPQNRVRGFTTAYLGMANVYYDFPAIIDPLSPFLGAGLGYGYLNGLFKSTSPAVVTRISAHDSVFAYQGIAGITFNFVENCALNIAYRYVGTSNIDDFGKQFQGHLVNVGAVYRFDYAQYK